jgi:hypothetical protein
LKRVIHRKHYQQNYVNYCFSAKWGFWYGY